MATVDGQSSGFRRIVDSSVAAAYRAEGWWGDRTLADRVGQLAVERPDQPAFITYDHRLTWREYARTSDRLAGVLIAAGIRPGERVAVYLPDGATVHAVFLAAEKAGTTIVGIGARAGRQELQHLLQRTEAVALITFGEERGRKMVEVFDDVQASSPSLRHHIIVPRFEADASGPVTVDGRAVESPAWGEDFAARRIGPDDLFMLNSTSGTTGLPKIVMHTQNRWMYFHQKAVDSGQLGDEMILSALPAPFGFGLWTAHFTPTLLGVPTVVLEHFSASDALELIERERVTMLCCVSTQFVMLLNEPSFDHRDLSSLRLMFTGGETIPYGQARAFEEKTGASVLQFFGSNETGVLSGTRLGEPLEVRLRTAGRIIPEMNVRLFDGDRDVTATGTGQPGCRGPATSPGYFQDPAANNTLFTSDGWMLMADVCTLDRSGYLTVVGRKSDITIRGGKNISAAHVEEALGSHPAVAIGAAVAMPDPVFGERVCGYVQLHPDRRLTLDELCDYLLNLGVSKEILPEHLIIVDELPRSAGGKVAKGELRADLARRLGGNRPS